MEKTYREMLERQTRESQAVEDNRKAGGRPLYPGIKDYIDLIPVHFQEVQEAVNNDLSGNGFIKSLFLYGIQEAAAAGIHGSDEIIKYAISITDAHAAISLYMTIIDPVYTRGLRAALVDPEGQKALGRVYSEPTEQRLQAEGQ